jgi:ADP-ribosyl-[dinitrogen reductase] hydrolase
MSRTHHETGLAAPGLDAGDVVGTAVEFKPRGSFAPLAKTVGGGLFDLPPSQGTNDTVDPENDFVLPPGKTEPKNEEAP